MRAQSSRASELHPAAQEGTRRAAMPTHTVRARVLAQLRMLPITVVLLLFTLVFIIPFVWMIMLSLRTNGAILVDPYGFPWNPRWSNYWKLMFDPAIRFYQYFVNSIIVTGASLAITVALSTMAGYGFGRARYNFPWRGALFALLLFSLMLPHQILYIPQYVMMARYHLINTRWALILIYGSLGLPVSVFLMSTYFAQLPGELEDAARIDGASDLRTFLNVMLPLARPALATVILINFLANWNELLLAITMVTKPSLRTLPAAMMNFLGDLGTDYAMVATSVVVAMVPILILYLLLSERFIEGLTAGAVKG
jgi:raffinose/stachyose/melibiose transport system permease protein